MSAQLKRAQRIVRERTQLQDFKKEYKFYVVENEQEEQERIKEVEGTNNILIIVRKYELAFT